jgi:hypothetical protein
MEGNNMLINAETGEFLLFDNFTCYRHMPIEEFEQKIDHKKIRGKEEYAYTNFLLHPQKKEEQYFLVSLSFNEKKVLAIIEIIITDSEALLSWSDWSEERERKRKKIHDEWLEAELERRVSRKFPWSDPYEFSWGGVGSGYDAKGGSSLIYLRYI